MTERDCRACGETFGLSGPQDASTLCEACRSSDAQQTRYAMMVMTEQSLDHERRFADHVKRGTHGYFAWVAECNGFDKVPVRWR